MYAALLTGYEKLGDESGLLMIGYLFTRASGTCPARWAHTAKKKRAPATYTIIFLATADLSSRQSCAWLSEQLYILA